MNIFIGYLLVYTYIAIIIVTATILNKKINQEISRKIIHISVGLSWFIMIYFFKDTYHLIIPPLTFIFFNYLSYKKGFIKAMEREENNSLGTVYYAISFTILSIITVIFPKFLPCYGIGVLSMALSDGLASIIGEKFNKYKIGKSNKTYIGSFTILVITLIVTTCFNLYYHLNYSILDFLTIAIISSILEFIGVKGTDNLTLPIGTALISYLFLIV